MKKIILAFIMIGSAVSCKKSGGTVSPPAPVCTVTANTIAGSYKITSVKYKASATAAESDAYAEPCKKDDTYQLNTDGTFTVMDIGVSCGVPPGPGAIDGWGLSNNNTILQLAGVDYTVESFNCTDLVVYQYDVVVAGDKKTTVYTKL